MPIRDYLKRIPVFGSMFKAQTTPDQFIESSVRVFDSTARHGKPRPWNYELAIKSFNGWAFSAAWLNASATASVPLRLYVRNKTGRKLYKTAPVSAMRRRYLLGEHSELQPGMGARCKAVGFGGDFEEVVEPHPILTVLREANGWENGHDSAVLRSLDRQLTGNSYIHPVIDRTLGIPSQYWRMPPQWVRIVPDRNVFIREYVYGAGMDIEQRFAPDEVIHFKRPNPGDLYYGKGWLEAAWTAVGLDRSKRQVDTAFADNYQRPDSLLMLEGLNGKQLGDALDRIREQIQGPDKAGRMIAVGAKGDLKTLNWQVTEVGTPDRVIAEIAACSGVPEAILRTADPNKAGAESARLLWYRTAILPECKSDEEVLNAKWIPLFSETEDVFVAYDPVSFEDESALRKNAIGCVAAGLLTPNEGRIEMGYGRVAGADMLYAPSGTTGGAAALAGNMSPGQNDARNNGEIVTSPSAGVINDQTLGETVMPPAAPAPAQETGMDANGTPAEAASTNDLRATVGGSAQILAMQEAYYGGTIPREAAIQNAVLVFGFTRSEAEQLFPVQQPENKEPEPDAMAGAVTEPEGEAVEAEDAPDAEPEDEHDEAVAYEDLYPIGKRMRTKAGCPPDRVIRDDEGHFEGCEGSGVVEPTGERGGGKPKPESRPKQQNRRTTHEKPNQSAKSILAQRTSRLVDASVQRYSEEHNETQFAKDIGGMSLRDNEPIDVLVTQDGVVKAGIELKTMTANKQNKIYMKADAMKRKAEWMKKNKAGFHTVVFDDQAVFNAKGEGKHDVSKRGIYYKRGFGSFRVNAMYKCKDMDELQSLIEKSDKELPDAAKPPKTYPKVRQPKK